MPKVEFSNPSELRPPPGGGYTHVVKAGNLVFLAGQTAVDKEGNVVGKSDIEAQSRQVFDNVRIAIESVGGSPSDIVRTRTYLTDPRSIPAYQAARNALFPKNPPGGTLLIVRGLASPDYLIEVEAEAVLSD